MMLVTGCYVRPGSHCGPQFVVHINVSHVVAVMTRNVPFPDLLTPEEQFARNAAEQRLPCTYKPLK